MPRRRSSAVIDEALWPLFGNCASRRSSCRASSHPVVHPTKTASCDRLRARRNYHGRFDRAALNGLANRCIPPPRSRSTHAFVIIVANIYELSSFLKRWWMPSVVTQKLYVCRIILNHVKHIDRQSSRCQNFFLRYYNASSLAGYSWWQKIWKIFVSCRKCW